MNLHTRFQIESFVFQGVKSKKGFREETNKKLLQPPQKMFRKGTRRFISASAPSVASHDFALCACPAATASASSRRWAYSGNFAATAATSARTRFSIAASPR